MQTLPILLAHWSTVAAGSLVAAVWKGAVLVACVALFLRLLPGVTAAVRSLVWSVVFFLLMLLPFASEVRTGAGTGVMAQAARLHFDVRWAWALGAMWAVLAIVRAAQLLRSALHLRGISKRAEAISSAAEMAKAGAALKAVPGRRTAEICTSEEVSVPSVVGFFSPRILLPPGLLACMSAADLQQIVLHEMEHLRRRDDWTNLLQKVSLVLFPLNPVLLWVERRLCAEREMACDDGVLQATGARKAYATCLANLAEQSLIRRGASLALGAWERRSELSRRVHRILRRPEGEMGRAQTAVMVSLLLLGTTGGVVALARTPQLVSFSGGATGHAVASAAAPATSRVENAAWSSVAPVRHARITLTKAIMPEARARATMVLAKHATRMARIPNAIETVSASHRGSSAETLVAWKRAEAEKQKPITLTFSEDSQFTYAAIPVQDGWLIVQL